MPVRIFLLGHFELEVGGARRSRFATRRGRDLLAFLIIEADRNFMREHLAGLFWDHLPEIRARKAFNTEIWRLCDMLQKLGGGLEDCIHRSAGEIGFKRSEKFWVDLDAHDAALTGLHDLDPAGAPAERVAKIEDAIALYRGDLLDGVYSDWCFVKREALRARHLAALEFMMTHRMEKQEWTAALAYGARLLALDPLMEHIHRAMMRCHYLSGNRPAAIRQFGFCEQLLREELDVEPMEETRRVHETILSVTPRAPVAVAEQAAKPKRRSGRRKQSPAQKIDFAMANLSTAQGWLEEASNELRRPG
jgi:DNA-binding SARP family transcriptional activator